MADCCAKRIGKGTKMTKMLDTTSQVILDLTDTQPPANLVMPEIAQLVTTILYGLGALAFFSTRFICVINTNLYYH
jgi:hypothetical protein